MPRLFIALDISDNDQKAIAVWRTAHLNFTFKEIPAQNFHITLAFIGSIDKTTQTNLQTLISTSIKKFAHSGTIELNLDHCGHFKKPKVYYIANSKIPSRLQTLATELKEHILSLGIYQDDRPYLPHISIFRKATYQPQQIEYPSIKIKITSVSLVQSSSTDHGVSYTPIRTWQL